METFIIRKHAGKTLLVKAIGKKRIDIGIIKKDYGFTEDDRPATEIEKIGLERYRIYYYHSGHIATIEKIISNWIHINLNKRIWLWYLES